MREFLQRQLEREKQGDPPGSYVARFIGPGSDGAHVLLRGVETASGQKVTDHVWMPNTREWRDVPRGSMVLFDAGAHSYLKGRSRSLDFGLNRPQGLTIKSAYCLYVERYL